MILHDWTTYFFAGCVVASGLGVTYYWEHYDIVRFDEPRERQFNEPEIVSGNWRCGHTTDPIEVGNYVVFQRTGDGGARHLARVIALEGAHVQVLDKEVLVDGHASETSGVKNKFSPAEAPEVVVPRACVYVLCDNRGRGGAPESDSRTFGPVPIDAITHTFRPLGKKD